MFGLFPLTPAYGRVYNNEAQVRQDFLANEKDFATPSGQYTSARELRQLGFKSATIRYGKNLELQVIISLEQERKG